MFGATNVSQEFHWQRRLIWIIYQQHLDNKFVGLSYSGSLIDAAEKYAVSKCCWFSRNKCMPLLPSQEFYEVIRSFLQIRPTSILLSTWFAFCYLWLRTHSCATPILSCSLDTWNSDRSSPAVGVSEEHSGQEYQITQARIQLRMRDELNTEPERGSPSIILELIYSEW